MAALCFFGVCAGGCKFAVVRSNFDGENVTYYVNGIYLLDDGRIETLGKQAFILGGCAILGTMVMFCVIIKLLARNFDEEGESES